MLKSCVVVVIVCASTKAGVSERFIEDVKRARKLLVLYEGELIGTG